MLRKSKSQYTTIYINHINTKTLKHFATSVILLCVIFFAYQPQHVQAININPLPTTCPLLDVDGNGKLEAFVDGVLLTRIINTKLTSSDIATSTKSFVELNKYVYDIDGDGMVDANIDGLLITRFLLGMQAPGIFEGISSFPDENKQAKSIQNLNMLCGRSVATTTVIIVSNIATSSTTITDSTTTEITGDQPDSQEQDVVCLDLKSNLKFKSRDENTDGEVSALQDFLSTYGYFLSEPSGYFGKSTVNAVKSFQSSNGLIASGVVGSYTREKVKSISCSDSPVKAVDDGIDKTRTQIQIIKSSPRADVRVISEVPAFAAKPIAAVKTISIRSIPAVFTIESLEVTTDTFVLKLKSLVSTDSEYGITIHYKNSSRVCTISNGFTPVVKQLYTIDRTMFTICKNGNTVGDFSTIDYISIEKK